MSNQANSTATPALTIDQQIDAMIARNGQKGLISVQGDKGDFKVTAHFDENGQLVASHETLRPAAPSSDTAIFDNGVDTRAEARKLADQLKQMDERLNAIAGYDQSTGKPIYALREGSRDRQNAELHRNQFARSVTHQLQVFQQLEAQRERAKTTVQSHEATQRLAQAYHRGDPARQQLLTEELQRLEAADAAAAIYAARKGNR